MRLNQGLAARGCGLFAASIAAGFGVFSCTPHQGTAISTRPESGTPVEARAAGDTLAYAIHFGDKADRRTFVKTFESFLERYPYGVVRRDTVGDLVRVVVLPPAEPHEGLAQTHGDSVAPAPATPLPDRKAFVESVIDRAMDSVAQRKPTPGGSVTIYSDRDFWDDFLASLVQPYPFAPPAVAGVEPVPAPFAAETNAPRRVTITLAPGLRSVGGQVVTAFDVVTQWTAFVKQHPAEGLALFRYVRGVLPYIRGREAVIPGFSVGGQTAVTLQLEQDDPDALARLSDSRLVPAGLRLGLYVLSRGASTAPMQALTPNRTGREGPPYLEHCTVVLGGDKNPFLSYSLKKYDCVTVSFRDEIEYSRKSLAADSRLVPLQSDRYFLALNNPTPEVRRFLRSLVNPAQLLNAVVKAEGAVIGALQSDGAFSAFSAPKCAVVGPVVVLYRKGDRISARIGEKLLADLSQAGVACELKAQSPEGYESALIDRAYTIAVGWAGERVQRDRAEQLRVADMWFGDDADEARRLSDAVEVPLFSVRRYVLCRNTVEFAGDAFNGVYVRAAESPRE
jgi:hypothetical protein